MGKDDHDLGVRRLGIPECWDDGFGNIFDHEKAAQLSHDRRVAADAARQGDKPGDWAGQPMPHMLEDADHKAEQEMTKKPFVQTFPKLVYPIKAVMTLSDGRRLCFKVNLDEHDVPQASLEIEHDRDGKVTKCKFEGTGTLTVRHEGGLKDFHVDQRTGENDDPEHSAEHADHLRDLKEDR